MNVLVTVIKGRRSHANYVGLSPVGDDVVVEQVVEKGFPILIGKNAELCATFIWVTGCDDFEL